MRFREFGQAENPVVVLLHGGGLSWWALEDVIERLRDKYFVVAPVIDGHGEDGAEAFISIEDSAEKLLRYVSERFNGRVFALGGLSLGAQIALEALSQRMDVAACAILESALVIPMPVSTALTVPMTRMTYGLISKRWFSRAQAKALNVPEKMFERYYGDSARMSPETLVGIMRGNGCYQLKPSASQTKADVLVIVGEKELPIMKRSAQTLSAAIPGSRLYVAKEMGHGELSMRNADAYCALMKELFARHEI